MRRVIDQPAHDGRRREQRQRPDAAPEREQLGRIDAAGGRHHVACACHQVRDGVDAGAVRDGCCISDGVIATHRIDIDVVAHAHGHQVAVRQHHALGAAGGAAGVEQPGGVAQVALGDGHGKRVGRRGEQGGGLRRFQVDLPLDATQRFGRHVGGDEGPARAAVGGDPFDLARVQLGVDRHGDQAGPPQAPHHFQVARVVAREDQHAVARLQAGIARALGQTGAARGPLVVRGVQGIAVQDGGRIGVLARLTHEQMGQGHAAGLRSFLFADSESK